jgi:hypothetical protein
MLTHGLRTWVGRGVLLSPVPKCEGPGAPTVRVEIGIGIGATRRRQSKKLKCYYVSTLNFRSSCGNTA